ncbi:MAG: CPBP family intramembrane metalloprotease [Acidobacteria bacterium]|nr:CPBP family intramembrane metalloprotease [Acidobacteriota bacterium]
MNKENSPTTRIAVFLIITFSILIAVTIYLVKTGEASSNMGMALLIMWSPGIAAIVTCLIFQRNLRGLGWKLGKIKYIALSYFFPLFATLIAYSIIWITGLAKFQMVEQYQFGTSTCGTIGIKNPPFAIALPVMLTWGLILRMIFALGEEIGWRGFLIPQLIKIFSMKKAAIISGIVWFSFHLPGLIFLDYYSGSRLKSTVFFGIMIISASVIMFWIRVKSGSLWTAAVFHASHNMAIQGIFNAFTQKNGNSDFFTGEFGLSIAVVYTIAAIWFWKRFDQLEKP